MSDNERPTGSETSEARDTSPAWGQVFAGLRDFFQTYSHPDHTEAPETSSATRISSPSLAERLETARGAITAVASNTSSQSDDRMHGVFQPPHVVVSAGTDAHVVDSPVHGFFADDVRVNPPGATGSGIRTENYNGLLDDYIESLRRSTMEARRRYRHANWAGFDFDRDAFAYSEAARPSTPSDALIQGRFNELRSWGIVVYAIFEPELEDALRRYVASGGHASFVKLYKNLMENGELSGVLFYDHCRRAKLLTKSAMHSFLGRADSVINCLRAMETV